MRIFHIHGEQFTELDALPGQLPAEGFVWIGCARPGFEAALPLLQQTLQRWGVGTLVGLHVSDLLNQQLPSQFDYTSWYDLLVFRRLAAAPDEGTPDAEVAAANGQRPVLPAIDTSPVGFAVFDRVLLTVHPADCAVREHFAQRLAALAAGHGGDMRSARLPTSPADLMLRMANHMVDSYLDLRRLLTRQLGQLQQLLLDAHSQFHDWQVLLDSRNRLHLLEDTCEDQRSAVQEWIDALDDWPDADDAAARRERELLRVRARDVLEHIERVLTHVRRLEQSAETAVQLHFSALGHRTNDIMRTLTVLTAVFLPLNLITGFFGMNFDGLPLIHTGTGVWIAGGMMVVIAVALGGFFWRRRYLGTSSRR
ncbi:magnesium transporter CorA family protein [Ideonella sp. DXS22W]|uniref:Magnesium transporter CorA family protein n=1 Tax=Pseudaquabacterium inlustre TaxID=2984192 RepID=A0ABU9CCP1_9BURK